MGGRGIMHVLVDPVLVTAHELDSPSAVSHSHVARTFLGTLRLLSTWYFRAYWGHLTIMVVIT